MSRPPEQQNTLSPHWWVYLCQWLWSKRGFIWGTLIVGIFVSVASTWLTSSTSIFTGTPLGTVLFWIREHLLLAGLIGVGLLLLTLLVGAVSHQVKPLPQPPQQQLREPSSDIVTFKHNLQETIQRTYPGKGAIIVRVGNKHAKQWVWVQKHSRLLAQGMRNALPPVMVKTYEDYGYSGYAALFENIEPDPNDDYYILRKSDKGEGLDATDDKGNGFHTIDKVRSAITQTTLEW